MHRLIEYLQRGDRHRRRVWIVADALRMEGVDPLDAAEEQFARPAAMVRAGVELVALQAVADIKIPAGSGRGVEAGQAVVCTEPQVALRIRQDAVDHIVGQAVARAV